MGEKHSGFPSASPQNASPGIGVHGMRVLFDFISTKELLEHSQNILRVNNTHTWVYPKAKYQWNVCTPWKMRWENVKQFWEQWCRKYLSYERANRLKCQTGSECFEKCWWNGEKLGSWCPKQERHCYWKTTLSLKVQTQVWLLQHHICFCCCFKFEWPQCFFWPGWENKPVALARMCVCNWRNYPRSSLQLPG